MTWGTGFAGADIFEPSATSFIHSVFILSKILSLCSTIKRKTSGGESIFFYVCGGFFSFLFCFVFFLFCFFL